MLGRRKNIFLTQTLLESIGGEEGREERRPEERRGGMERRQATWNFKDSRIDRGVIDKGDETRRQETSKG